MRVMGLDVSVTASGIAVVGLPDNFRAPGFDVCRVPWYVTRAGYALPESASFEETHRRIERINATVLDVAIAFDPDIIAIEAPVPIRQGQDSGFGNLAKMQIWAMNLIVQHTAFKIGKRVEMVPLGEWRAHFDVSAPQVKKENRSANSYQRSKLIKDLVRQRMRERYGAEFTSAAHNEAEAFAIAQYVLFRELNPPAKQAGLFGG